MVLRGIYKNPGIVDNPVLQILSDLLYYLLLVRDASPVKTWIELTFLQQLRFEVNKI